MRPTTCAALLTGWLLATPAVAQTVPGPTPSQAVEELPVRGPKLGSPEVFKPPAQPREGVTMPRIVRDVKASYTGEAIRARVQGVVKLDAVVLTDGTVGDVKVTQELHPDLDKEAVAAFRKWIFTPGTVEGTIVPFQVSVEMSFPLKNRPGKQ